MTKFTKIAAATVAISMAAIPASQAFAASKTENALIGAALGALAGALVSKGSDGGLLGAAAGAAVGVATDKPDRDRYGNRIVRQRAPVYRTQSYGSGYRSQQSAYGSYGSGYYSQPSYSYAQPSYGYAQPSRYGYGY